MHLFNKIAYDQSRVQPTAGYFRDEGHFIGLWVNVRLARYICRFLITDHEHEISDSSQDVIPCQYQVKKIYMKKTFESHQPQNS